MCVWCWWGGVAGLAEELVMEKTAELRSSPKLLLLRTPVTAMWLCAQLRLISINVCLTVLSVMVTLIK